MTERPCPRCGANPGEPCYVNGDAPTRFPHRERVTLRTGKATRGETLLVAFAPMLALVILLAPIALLIWLYDRFFGWQFGKWA